MKRYPVYRSSAASYSRAMGNLAVPVVILAILLQRLGATETSTTALSILAGGLFGVIAIALAVWAYYRLWVKGGTGWASAIWGSLAGLLALAPVIAIIILFRIAPPVQDLATNPENPPEIEGVGNDGVHPLEAALAGIIDKLALQPAAAEDRLTLQRQAYPDIVPRRYRIPPARLHAAVLEAVKLEGWELTGETPPDLLDDATRLQVASRSPVLGFVSDIAVRIRPDAVGSLMDVRAVSRGHLPDLTGNAGRIRKLLARIDGVLLSTYGDLEQLTVLEGGDLEPEPEAADGSQDAQDALPVPGFKPYFEGEDTIEPEQDL
ncbi:DUF1499 domain-containing protein [Roseibium sediminis]|uniref:DUF1499 domain-containing protein n=1 Tax=Roseibium sediminis TaxID=1775174 RepID=UPI00123D4C71|nr:DUF1499 domain-containing protein [Roseibium sediminis]